MDIIAGELCQGMPMSDSSREALADAAALSGFHRRASDLMLSELMKQAVDTAPIFEKANANATLKQAGK